MGAVREAPTAVSAVLLGRLHSQHCLPTVGALQPLSNAQLDSTKGRYCLNMLQKVWLSIVWLRVHLYALPIALRLLKPVNGLR